MPRMSHLPRSGRAIAALLSTLLSAAAAALAGCDDACPSRAGTYAIEVGPGTGTCGPDVGLPAGSLTFEVDDGASCRDGTIHEIVGTGEGCEARWTLTGVLDERGVHDATLSLVLTCDDGGGCEHVYQVEVAPAP